jgi:hypothetical protein
MSNYSLNKIVGLPDAIIDIFNIDMIGFGKDIGP